MSEATKAFYQVNHGLESISLLLSVVVLIFCMLRQRSQMSRFPGSKKDIDLVFRNLITVLTVKSDWHRYVIESRDSGE
jgi:hypothetical protein